MSREVPHLDDETCAQCGSERFTIADITGGSERGDLHIETHECHDCGADGTVTYTPPDSTYTLYGPLFDEEPYSRAEA